MVITKPDKGKGVVILNRADYLSKTEDILSDNTKFRELTGDWLKLILRLEDRLNRLLRAVKDKLPDSCYEYLFASGSLPGILYFLP